MRRFSLRSQLFASFLLMSLLCLLAMLWTSAVTLQHLYRDQVQETLDNKAVFTLQQIQDALQQHDETALQANVLRMGSQLNTRLTVVSADGRVLADSEQLPGTMDNHAGRPEVHEALQGVPAVATRFSPTLRQYMMYRAIPVTQGAVVIGVVRAATPLPAIEHVLRMTLVHLLVWCGVIAVVVALASFAVSRRISRPLARMKESADQFARGNFAYRMPLPRPVEMLQLAEAMNSMAAELSDKMATILKQNRELDAILSSMVEGVLAVDSEHRLLIVNAAATRLLDLPHQGLTGRLVQETVRHSDLQRLINDTLVQKQLIEREIVLHLDRARYLQANGTPLLDAAGRVLGALVVLNDVTRLKQLETMRRDFVANVSHELRTPITSIKGSMETLLDGALDSPDDARRFVGIAARQADRLESIIEDLLRLARIEHDVERDSVIMMPGAVRSVLVGALQACQQAAAQKNIRLDVDCADSVRILMNGELLEQAVINLIDNAIKYSPSGSMVYVRARTVPATVIIEVQDHGCGILPEHLPRLFERFYRVDKARSRKEGGTGLGLSIVKHIALVHRARVDVSSELGRGSMFSIILPMG